MITGQRRFDPAIADFDRAIKANPHYDAAHNNRGIVYKHKGALERAIKDFDRAVTINSGFRDGASQPRRDA